MSCAPPRDISPGQCQQASHVSYPPLGTWEASNRDCAVTPRWTGGSCTYSGLKPSTWDTKTGCPGPALKEPAGSQEGLRRQL